MRLNKERKLYAGIFALALGALTVDRLFLDGGYGPASASAAQNLALPAPAEDAAPLPSGPQAKPVNSVPVAKQIEALRPPDVRPLADGFTLPARWIASLSRQNPAADSVAAVGPQEPAAAAPTAPASNPEKLGSRRITGVVNVRDKTRACALIDGRRIAIGQALDGFTLTDLAESGAVFTDPAGNRLELRLPGPDNQPARE